jgi:hypothetical protein
MMTMNLVELINCDRIVMGEEEVVRFEVKIENRSLRGRQANCGTTAKS